ncbi:hypothetical protein J1614_004298 [Plenodomus biglobosus]|nr:hypothetical protein J1614_004298 [Plenodomus biglobosus]
MFLTLSRYGPEDDDVNRSIVLLGPSTELGPNQCRRRLHVRNMYADSNYSRSRVAERLTAKVPIVLKRQTTVSRLIIATMESPQRHSQQGLDPFLGETSSVIGETSVDLYPW